MAPSGASWQCGNVLTIMVDCYWPSAARLRMMGSKAISHSQQCTSQCACVWLLAPVPHRTGKGPL